MNLTRANFLHALSKIPYGGDLFKIATDESAIERFHLQPRGYFTVNNGFDPGFVVFCCISHQVLPAL